MCAFTYHQLSKARGAALVVHTFISSMPPSDPDDSAPCLPCTHTAASFFAHFYPSTPSQGVMQPPPHRSPGAERNKPFAYAHAIHFSCNRSTLLDRQHVRHAVLQFRHCCLPMTQNTIMSSQEQQCTCSTAKQHNIKRSLMYSATGV